MIRQHPQLDAGQLEIIGHLDGPTLGIAGPGSGKTLVIALMGANAVLEGRARPEEVVLCTHNRHAAQELRQRFMTLATAAGYRGNPERVRVRTIHSLCHQLLLPRYTGSAWGRAAGCSTRGSSIISCRNASRISSGRASRTCDGWAGNGSTRWSTMPAGTSTASPTSSSTRGASCRGE